ncbi:MAG: guanylate kinase [Candidatus Omnitrophota bacterium]|jgi:guanylate kinase
MATKIFILSGPSGAGKTTLLNMVLRKKNIQRKFVRAISCTTRKKRPGEQEGKDYFFIDKNIFLALKKKHFFLESQKVFDNYYGTPNYFYKEAAKQGKNLILCIDVKGGMYLKSKCKLGTIVALFITAPSELHLRSRLKNRVENEQTIQKRVALSKKEMEFAKHYDGIIINEDLKKALSTLEKIITAKTA